MKIDWSAICSAGWFATKEPRPPKMQISCSYRGTHCGTSSLVAKWRKRRRHSQLPTQHQTIGCATNTSCVIISKTSPLSRYPRTMYKTKTFFHWMETTERFPQCTRGNILLLRFM